MKWMCDHSRRPHLHRRWIRLGLDHILVCTLHGYGSCGFCSRMIKDSEESLAEKGRTTCQNPKLSTQLVHLYISEYKWIPTWKLHLLGVSIQKIYIHTYNRHSYKTTEMRGKIFWPYFFYFCSPVAQSLVQLMSPSCSKLLKGPDHIVRIHLA